MMISLDGGSRPSFEQRVCTLEPTIVIRLPPHTHNKPKLCICLRCLSLACPSRNPKMVKPERSTLFCARLRDLDQCAGCSTSCLLVLASGQCRGGASLCGPRPWQRAGACPQRCGFGCEVASTCWGSGALPLGGPPVEGAASAAPPPRSSSTPHPSQAPWPLPLPPGIFSPIRAGVGPPRSAPDSVVSALAAPGPRRARRALAHGHRHQPPARARTVSRASFDADG